MAEEIQSVPFAELQRQQTRRARPRKASPSDALFTSAALLPALLASSCCIPQLILNAFSFGCAGFAALTPFKPLFLGLTAIGVAAGAQRSGWGRRTALLALLAWSLAFSDVALRHYNQGTLQRAEVLGRPLPLWLQAALAPPQWVPRSQLLMESPKSGLSPSAANADSAAPSEATVILSAQHISCEACAARIKKGLERKFRPHVLKVEVHEKTKAVVVKLKDQAAVNDQALLAAMLELKSPAKVVRREVH